MSRVTLRRGPYYATIIPDRFLKDFLHHYVVQRAGSREILAWGQAYSAAAARDAALRHIAVLQEEERRAA